MGLPNKTTTFVHNGVLYYRVHWWASKGYSTKTFEDKASAMLLAEQLSTGKSE